MLGVLHFAQNDGKKTQKTKSNGKGNSNGNGNSNSKGKGKTKADFSAALRNDR